MNLFEDIKTNKSLNISFKLLNIRNISIKMHDAYEIIFVLRGSVDIKCTIFEYHLTEGDVFIVNVKELHGYSNGSDDNLVLMMHLDPYKYLNVFPHFDSYLFVCDSYANRNKGWKLLVTLQGMLVKLLFMATKSSYSSTADIEEQIRQLISFLINNFQSFYLSDTGYRHVDTDTVNIYQIQRLSEIQEYIYKNYRDKISLDALASNLNLNKYYVSHLIKNIIGLSMTDFISLTRIEQAEKLLFSTDYSIEQVAHESGFSAKRYFEKHFAKWFGITPLEHKKNVLKSKRQDYTELDINQIYNPPYNDIVQKYNHNKLSHNVVIDSKFHYNVNLNLDGTPFSHDWEEFITISDITKSLSTINYKLLEDIKKNLNTKYIRLYDMFNDGVENIENSISAIFRFLDFVINLNFILEFCITPSNVANSNTLSAVDKLFQLCNLRYGPLVISRWTIRVKNIYSATSQNKKYNSAIKKIDEIIKKYHSEIKIKELDVDNTKGLYTHDSSFLVPHIIHDTVHNKLANSMIYRELSDIGTRTSKSGSPLIHRGIYSEFGERKPIYYAWMFLSMLGNEILQLEDGIVVTKINKEFRILLYDSINKKNKITAPSKLMGSNITLNLGELQNEYTVTKLYLDAEKSLFRHRANMNVKTQYSREEIELMDKATFPTVSFNSLKKTSLDYTISVQLSPYSALLIIMKEKLC